MSRRSKQRRELTTAQEKPLLLRSLRVRNWRCFEDATVDFMESAGAENGKSKRKQKPRMRSIVVGRNGSGKTSLLRAVAVGLCQQREASALLGELEGPTVRRNREGRYESPATIEVELFDPEATEIFRTTTSIERDPSGQEIVTKQVEPEPFPWHRVFVGGYGVNRGARHREARSGYSRLDALRSLFSDDTSLLDPEATLRAISLADHEQPQLGLLVATKRHLRRLLQLEPSHRIDVTSQSVLVHGPWGAMPFHALGDGYRGTAGWVLDLLGLALAAGQPEVVKQVRGIALVDEIDEHLHPSWQRKLLELIDKSFPHLQVVGTTHSPMTIVDCKSDQLIACKLKNVEAEVRQGFGDPRGRGADEILRGEWFGLSSTLDSESEKMLGQYQSAIEEKKPEAMITRLREQLRERLGRRFDSPLDELALSIAAEARTQYRQATTQAERKKLVQEAAQRLRAQIDRGGLGHRQKR